MTYSIIGILASIILVISNRDILWNRTGESRTETQRAYRDFLWGVLSYYVTDMLWGILESAGLTPILYLDTAIHFVAMAAAVMLWTRYVVSYLGEVGAFGTALLNAGRLFLAFEIVVVAINFFIPILFWFDESGGYHASAARYVTLGIQIAMFLLCSVYTLQAASRTKGSIRLRHLTVGLFGIAMTVLIGIQVAYPLLPCYAMGYLLGTTVLHSFVVEDEKEEHRRELEALLLREQEQRAQLAESREALKEALAVAEEANRAKTLFLSNMSHEIRTPMNAIIGLTNIALADPGISDATSEHLQKIDSSAHHLLGIINDILDMSRIESGSMGVMSEEFSFAKMLAQVNTIISGQCSEKGLRYECRTVGDVQDYYVGDDIKLRQVLINILGNAVKFTPEGGSVALLVEAVAHYDDKSTLRFTMSDTGIGMSEDFLPTIFDAFSQEDSSLTNRYGSTGLGMPITKSIVELMNGTIEVESEKGVGTTFAVTVTLGDSERSEDADDEFDLRPQDLCVLVIDDDEIACEHAKVVLGKMGMTCDVALSAAQGLEMAKLRHARRTPYDLILVDWKMPEMDGLETTRQIRDSVGNKTPVVILTSYNWEDIADEAVDAGVDTFVSKPLFAGTVMEEFRRAFDRKNARLTEQAGDLAGRRVLLAEDVPVNAQIIVVMLSMREMQVVHVENGRDAVETFAKSDVGYFDAVLMDMRMPEMDGLEATRAIRALDRPDAETVPIIALTANAFDEDVQRSMQAGLNAHLSKPVEPETLFSTLEELIGR